MRITTAISILDVLRTLAKDGKPVTLNRLEFEAINEGISALKTLDDMKCNTINADNTGFKYADTDSTHEVW